MKRDKMREIKRYIIVPILLLTIVLTPEMTVSGELIYSPQNPSFGGNSFNASGLLATAQAQNHYKEPQDPSPNGSDLLSNFEQSLNRQVFSRLSREIISAAFGEGGDAEFTAGTYHIGDYLIVIDPQDQDVISIVITDELSGNETTIEVPYYDTQTKE